MMQGNIRVFIGHLVPSTTRNELTRFLDKELNRGWLGLPKIGTSRLNSCSIMRILDKDTGITEHHGMADISPSRSIQKAMGQLNGSRLCGKQVEVRQYINRSPYRDRRQYMNKIDIDQEQELERRENDRRRPHLHIEAQRNPKYAEVSDLSRIR